MGRARGGPAPQGRRRRARDDPATRATLRWLANQNCITPHVWQSRADKLDRPDQMVFDLDPSDEDFGAIREAALALAELLRGYGLTPFAKLSGSRGIHVDRRRSRRTRSADEVRAAAGALAEEIAAAHDDTLTTAWRKEKRDGRHPRRRRAQHLRADRRGALRRPRAPGRAGRGRRSRGTRSPIAALHAQSLEAARHGGVACTRPAIRGPTCAMAPRRSPRSSSSAADGVLDRQRAEKSELGSDVRRVGGNLGSHRPNTGSVAGFLLTRSRDPGGSRPPHAVQHGRGARHRRAPPLYRHASMGFLDKAKKLAEPAQEKLDEVQGQFNQQPGAKTSGPVTEYDEHGRPIAPAPEAPPTPGVPVTGSPAEPAVEAPPSAPPAAPTPGSPPAQGDRNFADYTPPTLTSGDPLAGVTAAARVPTLVAMRPYEGLLTAMVTPFRATAPSTRRRRSRSAATCSPAGSHGLVVAGTTGEAATMNDDEHIGLVELIVAELGDEGTIVAGTGSNDTRHAVHLTERAVAAGVDAVLSVTPYYNKPNRRGILAHFKEVARGRGRHAGDPLQHPRPHRHQHAARPARRARADRRHRGRQAGQLGRAAADRRPRRPRRQRRHLRPLPGHRRRRRHLRRLAHRRARDAADRTTSPSAARRSTRRCGRSTPRCSSPPARRR